MEPDRPLGSVDLSAWPATPRATFTSRTSSTAPSEKSRLLASSARLPAWPEASETLMASDPRRGLPLRPAWQSMRRVRSTSPTTALTPFARLTRREWAARFRNPRGVAVDGAGNVYVADSGNDTIRKIGPNGAVSTLAGLAGNPGSVDAMGSAARFQTPLA